jgi:hypothetical protein
MQGGVMMDEFDIRAFKSDEPEIPGSGPAPFIPGKGMLHTPEQDPHLAFACPFCETPVTLGTREGEDEAVVADCPCCETWFTIDEWRYYKRIAAA